MKNINMLIDDLSSSHKQLQAGINEAKTVLEIDGTIQRFEFVFELLWKTLKLFLENEGITSNSPRSCFKEAFRIGIICDEDLWLRMLADRNTTVHLYNEEMSRDVFSRIKSIYAQEIHKLIKVMKDY